mmetsp:Transcript_25051/g.28549  ORF Transcript_25051/g.28549 Transcript_25051/m.28549 type:complete len:153 (+) Transcript_25051:246-704(+)
MEKREEEKITFRNIQKNKTQRKTATSRERQRQKLLSKNLKLHQKYTRINWTNMKGGQRQNEYPKVGESGLKNKKNEGKKITRKKQQQQQQRTSSAKMPHSIYLSKHNLSDCHAPQPRDPAHRPLNPRWVSHFCLGIFYFLKRHMGDPLRRVH